MKFEFNWFFAMVVIPVIIGFFKTEIANFFTDFKIYRTRAFSVGDSVDLLNPNTGKWGCVVILDYDFNFDPIGRVVEILHSDGHVEQIPFSSWATMRKAPHVALRKLT